MVERILNYLPFHIILQFDFVNTYKMKEIYIIPLTVILIKIGL